MNILKKFLLVWKGREVLAAASNAKKGWKTIAFWVTLLGSLATYVSALKEVIPPDWALIIGTTLTAAYNVLRGLEKGASDEENKPWYKTTEAWLNIGTQIQNAMVTVQTGGVSTDALIKANVILTGVMATAQNIAGIEPKEVAAATPPEKK